MATTGRGERRERQAEEARRFHGAEINDEDAVGGSSLVTFLDRWPRWEPSRPGWWQSSPWSSWCSRVWRSSCSRFTLCRVFIFDVILGVRLTPKDYKSASRTAK